jgi:hypothetical protein
MFSVCWSLRDFNCGGGKEEEGRRVSDGKRGKEKEKVVLCLFYR